MRGAIGEHGGLRYRQPCWRCAHNPNFLLIATFWGERQIQSSTLIYVLCANGRGTGGCLQNPSVSDTKTLTFTDSTAYIPTRTQIRLQVSHHCCSLGTTVQAFVVQWTLSLWGLTKSSIPTFPTFPPPLQCFIPTQLGCWGTGFLGLPHTGGSHQEESSLLLCFQRCAWCGPSWYRPHTSSPSSLLCSLSHPTMGCALHGLQLSSAQGALSQNQYQLSEGPLYLRPNSSQYLKFSNFLSWI